MASLTVKMLRARLKKEGRSTKGLKDQLADRLLATLQAKEPTNKSRGGGASWGNAAALCPVSKEIERALLDSYKYKAGSLSLCASPAPAPSGLTRCPCRDQRPRAPEPATAAVQALLASPRCGEVRRGLLPARGVRPPIDPG